MTQWEPTRHGGFRRTGVAQRKSTAQIKRRPVSRKHPPVLIRLGERLGLPSCPYVIRWRLEVPFGSLRLHHWLAPDDDRAFHDHPWWFVTLVLRGGYTDRSPDGTEHLGRGSVRYRPALHRHTVFPDEGGAWTLLVTGPPVRSWGFWPNGKFRKANKWFLAYGHHPCELALDAARRAGADLRRTARGHSRAIHWPFTVPIELAISVQRVYLQFRKTYDSQKGWFHGTEGSGSSH